MRYLVIENGTVGNIIEAQGPLPGLDMIPDNGAGAIGDLWDGSTFTKPAPTREQLKAQRAAAVDAITVTTAAGHTFDGDEVSQTRMTRAIIALQATGTPGVPWVLHDNSVLMATVAELSEALALAGAAQAAIWVI